MGGDTDGQGSKAAAPWCRYCGEPVRRASGGPLGNVVHTVTEKDLRADGQPVAVPTDVNSELAETAQRVMRDFPEYEVAVVFGFLLRAAVRDAPTSIPVEGKTEAEMRCGIDNQVRMRRLVARTAEHHEATQP